MLDDEVIIFENLRQRSAAVVGQTETVKAQVKPFVSSNAQGVLKEVRDLSDVRALAAAAARKTKAVINAQ